MSFSVFPFGKKKTFERKWVEITKKNRVREQSLTCAHMCTYSINKVGADLTGSELACHVVDCLASMQHAYGVV